MSVSNTKFEFGRHETFSLRDGWLAKGLGYMDAHDLKPDVESADALGLGKNMVKSLVFWMEASGLASRGLEGKAIKLHQSEFAALLKQNDAHFEYAISNWFVHLHLARREGTIWNWFFNDFRNGSFDKDACVEAFHRYVRQNASNQTTPKVLGRDATCLLETYASEPPSEPVDPEDNKISPLRSLGLLLKHHDTGRYEKTMPLDPVPVEAFLACVQKLTEDADSPSLPLTDLISRRNSPARLFNIDGDAIDDLAHRSADIYGKSGVHLALLGSTRTITMPSVSDTVWYTKHFERIGR